MCVSTNVTQKSRANVSLHEDAECASHLVTFFLFLSLSLFPLRLLCNCWPFECAVKTASKEGEEGSKSHLHVASKVKIKRSVSVCMCAGGGGGESQRKRREQSDEAVIVHEFDNEHFIRGRKGAD